MAIPYMARDENQVLTSRGSVLQANILTIVRCIKYQHLQVYPDITVSNEEEGILRGAEEVIVKHSPKLDEEGGDEAR
jgi:hypothetical protein